jgi:hypothetical protein
MTSRKIIRIDNSSRSTIDRAGIRDMLCRRLRRTVEKTKSILPFDVGKDLSIPSHEIAFGQLDVERMSHIWNWKNNLGKSLLGEVVTPL